MNTLFDPTLADAMLRFSGRLHPLLVHFPIALFIVAAFLEVLRLVRRKPDPSPTAVTCIIIGATGAAAAAFSGWMNADFESHAESLADTLFWHRWLGVAVAAVGVILVGLAIGAKYVKAPAFQRVYALLLLATASIIGFTSHLGGSMVYGPDYMFEVFSSPVNPASGQDREAPQAQLPARQAPAGTQLTIDFARDIQPIFTQNCIECHGPSKVKGGVRLDHPGRLFTKEEDAWVVVPQAPDESELIARITMRRDEKGHMPLKRDSLSPDQITKIKTWIAEGAYWGNAAAPLAATPPTPAPALPAPTPAPAATLTWNGDEVAAIEALRDIGARVEPIAADSTNLDINLSLAGAKTTDTHLAAVARLGARVKTLNLARTPITDAGIAALAPCTALEKLHLEATPITDASLDSIAKLPALAYLNLVATKVTDTGIAKLAACKSLKDLYVADTAATLDAAIKLQEAIPGLNIELGIPK